MITIRKIRISNFKSIKFMELTVDNEKTVFVGQNNAGKSNINKAIDCVFNSRYTPSEYDIYDGIDTDEKCYIDIMLSSDTSDKKFEIDWLMIFADKIVENEFNEDSFTIRTVISQNESSRRYEIERFPIMDWESDIFDSGNSALPIDLRKCIGSFYLNSDRDIVDELRIRNSNFSRLMKDANFNLSSLESAGVEKALEIVNRMILRKMPSISEIEQNLSDISTTVDNVEELKILPIPNRFDDLDKGVEIQVKNAERALPISVYGDGTRSWISILTLSAYIESVRKQLTLEGLPYFAIVLLEEPESHLHPQAQNKVISQLEKIDAQVFISTHSSNIVSELGVSQLYRICNDGGTNNQTNTREISDKDRLKIINFILPFYSDILFSDFVILVEGITEKILLSQYIKIKMRKKPYEMGISIVDVGGKNNLPVFRLFCEIHSIKNVVFADSDAIDLLPSIKSRGLSEDNIIFTLEDNIEKEILKEQFEICKQLFIEKSIHNVDKILEFEASGCLYEEIGVFLKNRKSQYPHWIREYIQDGFRIRTFDLVVSTIGGR